MMRKTYTFLFILFFIPAAVNAYLPIPFVEQVKNADVFVRGKLLSFNLLSSKGKNLVVFNFAVTHQFGGEPLKRKSDGSIDVNYLLSLEELNSQIFDFQFGEEFLVLLKVKNQNYEMASGLLSQYKMIFYDKTFYLKSVVFPFHPKLGKLSYDELSSIVLNLKGAEEFLFPKIENEFRGRSIASIDNYSRDYQFGHTNADSLTDFQAGHSEWSYVWIVITLFFLVLVSRLILRNFQTNKK